MWTVLLVVYTFLEFARVLIRAEPFLRKSGLVPLDSGLPELLHEGDSLLPHFIRLLAALGAPRRCNASFHTVQFELQSIPVFYESARLGLELLVGVAESKIATLGSYDDITRFCSLAREVFQGVVGSNEFTHIAQPIVLVRVV